MLNKIVTVEGRLGSSGTKHSTKILTCSSSDLQGPRSRNKFEKISLKALWGRCILIKCMWQRVPQMATFCLKRIVGQRHDLCKMGINRLGHVLFRGYVIRRRNHFAKRRGL